MTPEHLTLANLNPGPADAPRAQPSPGNERRSALSRRLFLQATGLGVGAAMMPAWLADAAGAAAPIGASDGVLVLITMHGGADGLTISAPINDGNYHDRRGGLGRTGSNTLSLTEQRGLHPALTEVKARYDQGNVAVIEGVGDPYATLSHFEQLARVMTGRGNSASLTSGWLGRYVDGLPGHDAFYSVCYGSTVPLVMQGLTQRATSVSTDPSGILDISAMDPNSPDARQLRAMAAFGNGSTGLGDLADALADSGSLALDLGTRLVPRYNPALPSGNFAKQMALSARLINANLGIRVLSVDFGDFDGHSNHDALHDAGLTELNAGIEAFFANLDRTFEDRTLLLTSTEFGRRLKANRSGGTDHGTASTVLAIGSQVNGGLHGQMPSMTSLDSNGNLIPTVDFRSVYTTVLSTWLGADAHQILGGQFEPVDFVAAPGSKALATPPTVAEGLSLRNEVIRLYLAYFRRLPDIGGLDHWVAQRRGPMDLAAISAAFAASAEFVQRYGSLSNGAFVDLIYQNVLGRSADGEGHRYWTGQLNSGASRGAVMIGFSESAEFTAASAPTIAEFDRTGPVARLYRAYFLREPDRDGLEFWSGSGMTLANISQSFAESPEFVNLYGNLNDGQFVDLVYQNVMGRPGDGEGRSFWTARLSQGSTRGSVMMGFSESPEFVNRVRSR